MRLGRLLGEGGRSDVFRSSALYMTTRRRKKHVHMDETAVAKINTRTPIVISIG